MTRKRKLLGLILIILLTGVIFPALPTWAQTGSPPGGSLVGIVFPDTEGALAQFGVYLGHGLILTNWHPWTLDGQAYTDKERLISASRQIATYDDDGMIDPSEHLLNMTGFARIEGAGFVIPGNDILIPVERLVYANRETDIALFTVDAAAIEAQGAILARLSLAIPGAESPVLVSLWPDQHARQSVQGAETLPAVLVSDQPELLPASEGPNTDRRLDGPWRAWSLRLEMPEYAPEGSPVFDKTSGALVGLVWRSEGVIPTESWLTPAAVWLHDLHATNESIQSEALAAVLRDVTLTPVYGDLTLHDPHSPELGNSGIDVQHVALDLVFDLDAHTITGTATLELRATAQGLISFGLDASGLEIERVTVDGNEVPFAIKTEKLLIELAEPVDFGAVLHVEIAYFAAPEPFRSPYMPGFDIGMFWGDSGNLTVSTLDQPDGAHTWFPINDHPSDRATYEFRFRVPEPLTAVTNGELVETIAHDDGTRTFYWRMDQPMASYLTVVAVAEYVAIEDTAADGTPITHYVYADQALTGRDVFGYTDEALAMLEAWFGPYPYARYGHVIAPVQGMALETQTMTTLPDLIMGWTELEIYELMVHELTHQWFGNTVTPGVWSDIWLNEGFARYAQWLARDTRFGAEAAMAARSSSEQRMIAETRRTPLIDPLPEETFGTATYDKGGWVLHMLRSEIGDAAFFDLLQTWAMEFADRPASTLDFWQLAEEVSGQDLAWFFEQWLLQADDMPDVRLYWTETGSGVDVLLCPAELENYRLDVPVRFLGDGSAALDAVIELGSIKGAEAQFELDFVPRTVIADADQQILAQIAVQPIDVLPGECWGGL